MIEIALGKPHLTLAALAFMGKLPGWGGTYAERSPTNRAMATKLAHAFRGRLAENVSFFMEDGREKNLSWIGVETSKRVTTWSDFVLLAVILGEEHGIPPKTVKQNLTMLRRISNTVLEQKGIAT